MLSSKRVYAIEWVAIQNTVQECFKSMSLDEKRLLILASPIARTTGATSLDKIHITAESFAKECGIDINSAYSQLKLAGYNLVKRYFSYNISKNNKVYCNWIIRAVYTDGGIDLYFPEEVLYLLQELDKYNPYTKYKKEIALSLLKDYSIDFYHLAKKSENTGYFDLMLNDLFTELKLPDSYKDLSNLKRRVIEPSLNEINEKTDIKLTYENIKKGRTVTGFRFKVKPKSQPVKDKAKGRVIEHIQDPDTPDLFHQMTPKQIAHFARLLAEDANFGSIYAQIGQSSSDFAAYVAKALTDPQKQQEWALYLSKHGYKPKVD